MVVQEAETESCSVPESAAGDEAERAKTWIEAVEAGCWKDLEFLVL